MKSKLIFDVTDANTIADSDSIGAFIRASDGSLIAHTSNALNVHIASGASSGTEFAEDSAHTTGDLGTQILAVRNDIEGSLVSANGDYASLQLDASGRLRTLSAITGTVDVSGSTVTIQEPLSIDDNGSSITVDAVDLDIRNLVFATDKVDASGSTLGANDGVDIGDVTINNAAGASAVNIQDGGNSITVDAINLDIRDLNFATDSVTSRTQDGSGNAITSTAGSLDVNVTSENDDALANTAIKAKRSNSYCIWNCSECCCYSFN